jgi:hypothetical protein
MQTELAISLEVAEAIMLKMVGYYGEAFSKKFKDVERNEMIQNIQDVLAGLERDEVVRGLSTMRTKAFCPTLPEFRSWCVKGSSQFTDVDVAYINAAHEKYTDAATYEAARRTGFFELSSRAETSTKPIFKKHYEAVCDELTASPQAFVVPKAQRIEAAPANYIKKDSSFFENLRKGVGA